MLCYTILYEWYTSKNKITKRDKEGRKEGRIWMSLRGNRDVQYDAPNLKISIRITSLSKRNDTISYLVTRESTRVCNVQATGTTFRAHPTPMTAAVAIRTYK